MKKLLIILITLITCAGCGCVMSKASDAVKDYLNKYNNQDNAILTELDNLVKRENLSSEQGEKYKEIMKKQYTDLKFEIVEETYNGDEASVKTKITVYDLFKAQKEADEYKNNNRDKFIGNDGMYSSKAFLDYKLDKMKKEDTQVEYTIDFKVIKKDGKWILNEVSTKDLEKIHGIYNYAND